MTPQQSAYIYGYRYIDREEEKNQSHSSPSRGDGKGKKGLEWKERECCSWRGSSVFSRDRGGSG